MIEVILQSGTGFLLPNKTVYSKKLWVYHSFRYRYSGVKPESERHHMIQLTNVSKYYYTDSSVTQALDNISLTLPDTGFIAITGESGSGKSTLLNIISGMDTFDDGEMYVDGEPTFQYDSADWEEYRRNKIGFVFQNYGLIDHYTVTENILAALYIQGSEKKDGTVQAEKYEDLVGLLELKDHRASELSSGQKQRLSIARALAKKTKIIVADEPTGNLDSETGNQIIEIFKKLSRDHLIIMVTHNIEQAEGSITQKIRLHDGVLVSDITYGRESDISSQSEDYFPSNSLKSQPAVQSAESRKTGDWTSGDKGTDKSAENEEKSPVSFKSKLKRIHSENKTAFRFFCLDASEMKGRTAMFLVFFLFTAVISFIFMGELFTNADDRSTKRFNKEAFTNESDRRLLARHSDGSAISDQDIKKISSLKYVEEADKYDVCGDIQYYCVKGRDYTFVYGDKKSDGSTVKRLKFYNTRKFMRSASAIPSGGLKAGRAPSARNEIAVHGKSSEIGKTIRIYFRNKNLWNKGEYYLKDMKITGVLKGASDQIYFSPDFCTMLTATAGGSSLSVDMYYDALQKKFNFTDNFIPVIGEGLADQDGITAIRGSEKYKGKSLVSNGNVSDVSGKTLLSGKARIKRAADQPGTIKSGVTETLQAEFSAPASDKNEKYSNLSPIFMEVSEKTFDRFYPDRMASSQAAVYISDYTKTDRVIKELSRAGFDSISTYRVSTTRYVRSKVMKRFVTICISAGVLILISILEILILRSLMKIKINEFLIFKFMGMKTSVVNRITVISLFVYDIVTALLTLILGAVLYMCHTPLISEIFRYYTPLNILIYLLFGIILSRLTAGAFNRLLKVRSGRKPQ